MKVKQVFPSSEIVKQLTRKVVAYMGDVDRGD